MGEEREGGREEGKGEWGEGGRKVEERGREDKNGVERANTLLSGLMKTRATLMKDMIPRPLKVVSKTSLNQSSKREER